MKKSRPKTLRDIRNHALKRIKERYNIVLSINDYDRLNNKIRRGEYIKSYRQSHTRTRFQIEYNGVVIICVYDKLRHGIVTFLPRKKKLVYH